MIKQSKVTSLSTTGICECSVREFKVHGSKFLIMSVYRPCSGDINDFIANMDEVLLKCLNNNSIIVVAGNFNIPMHNDNKDKDNFFALMNYYNLFPTVEDFTRVTSTSQSLIDNIFTNSKEYHSVEVFHNWISDHTAQKIIYYVKRQNKQHIVKRVCNQRNKEHFKKKIEKVTWAEVYKSDKVNEAWENLEKYFMYHFNEYFPEKKINVRKKTNESCNDPEVIRCKEQLDILLVLSSRDNRYKGGYNNARKRYKFLLSQNKAKIFKNKIEQSDNKSKCVWSIINDIKGSAKKEDINIQIPGEGMTVANNFNKHFIECAPSLVTEYAENNHVCHVQKSDRCQHAYLKGKGTQTAIYRFTQVIYETLEKNEVALGLFLDSTKALIA
ncbi:hypothetical protein JTB14_002213 [Gonioctena quinquepunctata]|nr:hypothetical protein JTB14_002213 [Gonioctena quinquepunctata]